MVVKFIAILHISELVIPQVTGVTLNFTKYEFLVHR